MSPVKVMAKQVVYQGRSIDVCEEQLLLPSGSATIHTTVLHRGAVVIVPLDSHGNIILLRQYRHSLQDYIIELPAGTLNIGEEPESCARRELPEETGLGAMEWRSLGTLYPAPGFCNEIQHCFLARQLYPNRVAGDEDEFIEVQKYAVSDVEKLIMGGTISDSKSLAVFFRARLLGLL